MQCTAVRAVLSSQFLFIDLKYSSLSVEKDIFHPGQEYCALSELILNLDSFLGLVTITRQFSTIKSFTRVSKVFRYIISSWV